MLIIKLACRCNDSQCCSKPVPTLQADKGGQVCDVIRGFARCRGLCSCFTYQPPPRQTAANAHNHYYRRCLFHRLLPGIVGLSHVVWPKLEFKKTRGGWILVIEISSERAQQKIVFCHS